jgi:protein TonB
MFESLDRGQHRNAAHRLLALLLSLLIHSLGIVLIVILPLMFLRMLPEVGFLTILVAAPVPPPAPPPPIPPASVSETQAGSGHRTATSGTNWIPDMIPKGIQPPTDEPPMIGDVVGMVGIGPGAGAGLSGPGLASSLLGTVAAPAAPGPPPAPPKRVAVPVGGKVQEAKLIRKVSPEYPGLALRARVSGDVILEVTVDEEGSVSGGKVL